MSGEHLRLEDGLSFESEAQRQACVRFFNAAYRAEESGLQQAHALARCFEADDPDLAQSLRLYGNEEGWHRQLLEEFLSALGGEVKPVRGLTRVMYSSYGRMTDMASIVLTNLMFETIGATTYRLALRRVKQETCRQMLEILTRDESFHVPLNVHFLRSVLGRGISKLHRAKLQAVYHGVFMGLALSARRSRRAAQAFDGIPFRELLAAYMENLGKVFASAPDLGFEPPRLVLRTLGISMDELLEDPASSPTSVEAAIASVDRAQVHVVP
jgi:hypothetical protein